MEISKHIKHIEKLEQRLVLQLNAHILSWGAGDALICLEKEILQVEKGFVYTFPLFSRKFPHTNT